MRASILPTILTLLTSLSFSSASTAATPQTSLSITILSSPKLPNPNTLPSSTTASLTSLGKIISVPISTSNTFDFRNVTEGSYLLDVHCKDVEFAPLRVDVFPSTLIDGAKAKGGVDGVVLEVEAWRTFRGNEWGNKGEKMGVSREVDGWVKVEGVRPLGGKEYYVQRAGFSPLSLLKNPMILIAGVSMIIVFGMPYIMDNMDPEMRAEFEEAQKSSPMNALLAGGAKGGPAQNFDAAGWLAGQGKGKDQGGSVKR